MKFHVLRKPWIGPISKKQHVNVGQTSQLLLTRVALHFDIFNFLCLKRIKRLTWRRAVTWVRRILGIAGMSSLVENLFINWQILFKIFRKYLLYLSKGKRLQKAIFGAGYSLKWFFLPLEPWGDDKVDHCDHAVELGFVQADAKKKKLELTLLKTIFATLKIKLNFLTS